jgi:hypothetical protein
MKCKNDTGQIIIASMASYLFMAMVYPDLLIHHKVYFLQQHDTEIPFLSTFTLISNFYNGGIQLWDPYDQMGLSYFHLSTGFYTFANIVTAAIYILLAPTFDYPGEAFQSLFSICFYASTILVRTAGGYLLLKRFKISPFFVFISLIYLNTFFFGSSYLGLLTNNLYSYFPLLAYFMLRFFENCKLNDFLASVVVMTLAVANSPLMALGYFYQAVHFYMLVGLVGAWFLYGKPSIKYIWNYLKKGITLSNIAKSILVGGLCFAIMFPYLQMEKTLKTDFYIPEAFDKSSDGRMTNKYSIEKYFSKTINPSFKPSQYLRKSVVFNSNQYYKDWGYLGISTFIFTGMGLIFSRDKRKHFFIWPFLLLAGLLFPRDPSSLLSISHWANVLTNPLQYLCRDFSMTAFLIPCFLLPLIALGMQSSKELIYYNNPDAIHFERIHLGLFFLVVCLTYFSFSLPEEGDFLPILIKIFLCFLVICLIFIWASWEYLKVSFFYWMTRNRRSIVGFGISIILLFDLSLFSVYISKNIFSNVRIFSGHSSDMLDKGLINVAYQNPQTQPIREFYSSKGEEIIISNLSARDELNVKAKDLTHGVSQDSAIASWYRLNTRQSDYGNFYKFTHLGRYFFPANIYHPRHMAYKDLDVDIRAQKYLENDGRIIFQANYAIDSDKLNHSRDYKEKVFLQLGSAYSNADLINLVNNRYIVSIEGLGERIPYDLSESSLNLKGEIESHQTSHKYSSYSFPFEKGKSKSLKGLIQYSFDLPKDFPAWISTSLFTQDQFNTVVSIENQNLEPAQGKLVRPFTYDVQNIKTGKLMILLPEKYDIEKRSATLGIKKRQNVLKVWKNENDNLGIDYYAEKDGWIVFHFPYDRRWKITNDDKSVAVYRANKYFLSFPVKKGEHKILLQYWPDTNLRAMIAVSIFLVVFVLPILVMIGICRENLDENSHPSLT